MRHTKKKFFALCVILALVIAYLALTGCGSVTNRQSKKTTSTTYRVDKPLVADTPAGQVVISPFQYTVFEEEQEAEVADKTDKPPELPPVATAIINSTPWGAMITGAIGLITTAVGGYKALTASRQRDEVIAGNERSKDDMSSIKVGNDPITGKPLTAWDVLTTHLEAEQSADTIAVVAKKTP